MYKVFTHHPFFTFSHHPSLPPCLPPGLHPAVADRIGTFVTYKGAPKELLALLLSDDVFKGHEVALGALAEMETLFGYLEAMGSLHAISFDLSLARGLDYYTGRCFLPPSLLPFFPCFCCIIGPISHISSSFPPSLPPSLPQA